MEINRDELNACNARRKAERIVIANTLESIVKERGATLTERRDEPANPGFCGQGVSLHIKCKGVGCMIDIDNLHGGEWALIHWFNTDYPVRNFTSRFQSLTGGGGNGHPHHKSTSHPRDWYSLAMMLDSGLMLAVRGEAFEPIKVSASAT